MEYTIEQKAVALLTNTLWWRLDVGAWTRLGDDIVRPDFDDVQNPAAEYHIGDKPPKPARVLSELERELLAALEGADRDLENEGFSQDGPYRQAIRAAIAKAKGEA